MKKLVTIALVAILALGVFTACRRADENLDSTTSSTSTTSASTSTSTTASTSTVTVIPSLPDGTLDSTGPSENAKMPQMPWNR